MINQAVTLNYALDGRDATDYPGDSFFSLLTQRLNVMSSNATQHEMYTADGMWFKSSGSAYAGITPQSACNANDQATVGNACAMVTVDVNGAKGPNKPTTATTRIFDIFTIVIYPQKSITGR